MEQLVAFISEYIEYAPALVFVLILLAGLNIPISLDALMVFSAFSSATIAPHLMYHFYFSLLFGSIFSAWICFGVGRFLGPNIERIPILNKLISRKKIDSIGGFYSKYGLPALILGRFIPFGVRNLIFLSKGMSNVPFKRFMFNDAIACTIWATVLFWTLFWIGESFEALVALMKKGNLIIFSVFGMSVIAFFCYKYFNNKKKAHDD